MSGKVTYVTLVIENLQVIACRFFLFNGFYCIHNEWNKGDRLAP